MRVIAGLMVGGALLGACAPAPPANTTGPQPCNAEAARSLIGKHMDVVDFAHGDNVRFVCTTCAATEDHRPDRLNIRFDEATGIIRSVDCG